MDFPKTEKIKLELFPKGLHFAISELLVELVNEQQEDFSRALKRVELLRDVG